MRFKIYKGDFKTSIVSKPDIYPCESEIIVKIPSKKRYTINLIIKSRKKAELKRIIQEALC